MGAFTSTDIQKYQARYALPKQKPGYQSIRTGGKKGPTVLKTPKKDNSSIWFLRQFDPDNCPAPRIGHCSVPVPQYNGVVVCYGATEHTLLSDFWYFNLTTHTWMQKAVDQSATSPRTGAKAVIIDNELWVFGGSNESGLLSDLHVVNLADGSIRRPATNGPEPSPRMNHVMSYHDNKILIYSGTAETVMTDLYILDIPTLTWQQIDINHGRSSASYCMFDNYLYVYGASTTSGFLRFDFKNDAELIPVSGMVPSSAITNAVLVPFDRYILMMGGDQQAEHEDDRPFAPIYLYDVDASQWSIFPVAPDNDTTSIKDGEVDKNGNFRLPLVSQATGVYDPIDREIHIFLGYPPPNSPLESVFEISTPLSSLHIQSDMLCALRQYFH